MTTSKDRLQRAGLLLASAFYVVAGILHFIKPEVYVKIVPPSIPSPAAMLVRISGLSEV